MSSLRGPQRERRAARQDDPTSNNVGPANFLISCLVWRDSFFESKSTLLIRISMFKIYNSHQPLRVKVTDA